ncbi:S9 family peptidase [Permianibacter aggregans]|nr:S9 family peptidase [Permianibacter aggregans]
MKPALLLTLGISMTTALMAMPPAPVAEKIPYTVSSPSGDRVDQYYWLRDDSRSDEKILTHLRAEQSYYRAYAAQYTALTEQLANEIIGRIKQDDSSVPVRWHDYAYSTRFEPGKEYPLYVRRSLATDQEHVMIDGNKEAEGKGYYSIGKTLVSTNQQILAYADDDSGRRQYTIRFRDLQTGKNFDDVISGSNGMIAWANDNKTVFYIENDPVTLLSTRVKKHVLGTPASADVTVYEEQDKSFYMSVANSKDRAFVVIALGSTTTSEALLLDANQPDAGFKVFAPRETDIKYSIEHMNGRWFVLTDWQAPNYKIMTVSHEQIGSRKHWQNLIAHDDQVFVDEFEPFVSHLVIGERSNGLRRIRVIPWSAPEKAYYIDSDESAYSTWLDTNLESGSEWLRYGYTSLTTPSSVYEIHMQTKEKRLLKQQEVLGGFDKNQYRTERVWADARDGTKIPVSLLYKKDFIKDGKAPLYQYAYGSYGASMDPTFRSAVLSLVDRGFVYAIAHIRGGQDMGRQWYENGKLLKKKNTFTDFIDVTDYLVKQRYAAKDKVFAMGGSAGGLLMGAVANMAGEKYKAMIAHVPFVDVVTTMLDESIPLTTNEFDEWGNPKKKEFYDYMLSYSPYDQLQKKAYPALLVTTGLHDSQVQYFEPAKWVAKLREYKTDQHPLLFNINMEAGHGGKSGRFQRMKEVAEEYAFVLWTLEQK